MAKRGYAIYKSFLGMNDTSAPDTLLDTECRLIENCDLSERGGITMRAGSKLHYDTANNAPVDTIIEFRRLDGSIHMLYGVAGKLIRQADNAVLLTGLPSSVFSHIVYNNKLYLVNGTAYYVYDGTSVVPVTPKAGVTGNTLTEVSRCKYMVVKDERIFYAGDSQNPNSIYYSEIGDPTNVPALNFFNAVTGDSDVITGLSIYKGGLMIYKNRSIFAYLGTDIKTDAILKPVDTHTGAASNRAVVKALDKAYFVASDGVYHLVRPELTDQISAVKVSGNVQGTVNSLTSKAQAVGVFHEDKLLFFGNTTSGYKGLVYHTGVESEGGIEPWTIYTGLNVTAVCTTWEGKLLLGTSTGKILEFTKTEYTDSATRIPVKVETKLYDMDKPFHVKKIKKLYVAGQQNTSYRSDIKLTCKVGYNDPVAYSNYFDVSLEWGEGYWGYGIFGNVDVAQVCVPINQKGSRLSITVENFETGTPFTMYGMMIEFKEKKPDKYSFNSLTPTL